jgi:hypothetical protein
MVNAKVLVELTGFKRNGGLANLDCFKDNPPIYSAADIAERHGDPVTVRR